MMKFYLDIPFGQNLEIRGSIVYDTFQVCGKISKGRVYEGNKEGGWTIYGL